MKRTGSSTGISMPASSGPRVATPTSGVDSSKLDAAPECQAWNRYSGRSPGASALLDASLVTPALSGGPGLRDSGMVAQPPWTPAKAGVTGGADEGNAATRGRRSDQGWSLNQNRLRS